MPNRHINCTTVILLFLPAGQLFLYLRIIWIFFFFDLLGAVSGKLKIQNIKNNLRLFLILELHWIAAWFY